MYCAAAEYGRRPTMAAIVDFAQINSIRRQALLIHFPGSDAGEVRTEPFPEIETTAIIQAMLTSKLRSQADLDMWLDAREATRTQNLSGNYINP
jgi:hypothetical protein